MKTPRPIRYAFDKNGIVMCIHRPSEFRVQNTLRAEDCDRMTEEEINKLNSLRPVSKKKYTTLEED